MPSTNSLKTLQAHVDRMDCGGCAKTIEASLRQLPGVQEAQISFATGRLSVSYDPEQTNEAAIRDRVTALGYTVNAVSANPTKTFQAKVGGMDCGGCARTIEANLQQLAGVNEVSISFATERLNVSYDPTQVNETDIIRQVTDLGYTVQQALEQPIVREQSTVRKLQARVKGMDCGSCAKTIEASLQQLAGISDISISFDTERLEVSYDLQQVSETDILNQVTAFGYSVESVTTTGVETADLVSEVGRSIQPPANLRSPNPNQTGWQFWLKTRRGQTVVFSGIGIVLGVIAERLFSLNLVAQGFYAISLIVAELPIARAAWIALKLRRADMNLLMTLAAIGAAILNYWFQGALVIFLFALGTTLQTFTLSRTRNAIRDLMNLTPSTATVKRNAQEVSVPVESIQVGEILTVRPGQRIALDGVVVAGVSAVG
jgi:Cd2+/Zn2+-exporting ATPase